MMIQPSDTFENHLRIILLSPSDIIIYKFNFKQINIFMMNDYRLVRLIRMWSQKISDY